MHATKAFADRIRRRVPKNELGLLLVAFVAGVLFFGIVEPRVFNGRSIGTMMVQLPEIGLMALGMMVTIIAGGIDLSINATSNLAALIAGLVLVDAGNGGVGAIAIAVVIALAVGAATGVLNGLLVGYVAVPPILATLATLTLFRGIAVGITKGKTVTGFPPVFSAIGHGTALGIPVPFVLFLSACALVYVLLVRTPFGFRARMLGSSPRAARFSGIDNRSITMKVYIVSGLLGALAGLIVMSRTNSAAYEYGTRTYVLLAILITVFAEIRPGHGNIVALLLAVVYLQLLSTGFQMLLAGVRGSAFFKDFAWGVLLIAFIAVNAIARRRKHTG